MTNLSQDIPDMRLYQIQKIISRRTRIMHKAAMVLSKDPPVPEYISVKKVVYLKPYQKVSLPPLKTRKKLNQTLNLSRTPIPFHKFRPEGSSIGVLEGVAKLLV